MNCFLQYAIYSAATLKGKTLLYKKGKTDVCQYRKRVLFIKNKEDVAKQVFTSLTAILHRVKAILVWPQKSVTFFILICFVWSIGIGFFGPQKTFVKEITDDVLVTAHGYAIGKNVNYKKFQAFPILQILASIFNPTIFTSQVLGFKTWPIPALP